MFKKTLVALSVQSTLQLMKDTAEQAKDEGIAVSEECSGVCDYQLVNII